jgi:hypothetical protein
VEKEGRREISNDLTKLYPPRFHMCHSFLHLVTKKKKNIFIFLFMQITGTLFTQNINNEIQKYLQSSYFLENLIIW